MFFLPQMKGNAQVRLAEVDVTCLKLSMSCSISLEQDSSAETLVPLTVSKHIFVENDLQNK